MRTIPKRARVTALPLAALTVALLAGCGGGAAAKTAAAVTSHVITTSAAPTTEPTTEPAPTTTYSPPPFLPVTSSSEEPVPTTTAAPAGFTCAQVGGVFQQNYPDGRGDCVSADPRPACHIPLGQQPDNYLAELTMTPPSPGGLIDLPELVGMASNADCWKNPLA